MALPAPFKQAVDEFDQALFEVQRRMAAVRGEAELAGIPEVFKSTLERKTNHLGHIREEVRALPAKVDAEEAELEAHAEELRRRREGDG